MANIVEDIRSCNVFIRVAPGLTKLTRPERGMHINRRTDIFVGDVLGSGVGVGLVVVSGFRSGCVPGVGCCGASRIVAR